MSGQAVALTFAALVPVVLGIYAMVTQGVPGLITGSGVLVAFAMMIAAYRLAPVNGAVAQRVGDSVQLPRRTLYAALSTVSALVLGTGLMAVGAFEHEPGIWIGRMGDPYVFTQIIGFVIFVAGVAALVGIVCGRGSMRFTETDVQRRPLLWRRRCFAWDQLRYEWQGDTPGEKGVLVLQGPSFHSRVEIEGQAWSADQIDAALAEFAAAGPAGRRAMIDSGWTGPQGHRHLDQPKSRRKPTRPA